MNIITFEATEILVDRWASVSSKSSNSFSVTMMKKSTVAVAETLVVNGQLVLSESSWN